MRETTLRTPPHGAAALHALFARTARRSENVILPINDGALGTGNERPAFYCVHSLSGAGGTDFRELAKLMPDVRFYGIQAPTTKMQDAEFGRSVELLADHYADALVRFQPDGPFLLGGWSAGATIALEIAQTLLHRGREVRLLAAIDAAPENTGAGLRPWHPLYLLELAANLPGWVRHDLRKTSLRALVRRVSARITAAGKKAVIRDMGKPGLDLGFAVEGFVDLSRYPPDQKSFMKRLYNAVMEYNAVHYSEQVVVYEAKVKPLSHLPQVGAVWRKLAPRSVVIRVDGTHLSIMREGYVHVIAEDLRKRVTEGWSDAARGPLPIEPHPAGR
ncbi:MAG TPA: thioesterase domain-containing protein [Acetobacteraceae bacterium]|nr:thioesterase domain-containing protein [Acetobacteraceae bacterium]